MLSIVPRYVGCRRRAVDLMVVVSSLPEDIELGFSRGYGLGWGSGLGFGQRKPLSISHTRLNILVKAVRFYYSRNHFLHALSLLPTWGVPSDIVRSAPDHESRRIRQYHRGRGGRPLRPPMIRFKGSTRKSAQNHSNVRSPRVKYENMSMPVCL